MYDLVGYVKLTEDNLKTSNKATDMNEPQLNP